MARGNFTEADLRKVYSDLRAAGQDAAADFGEVDDCLAYELAACTMMEDPRIEEYLRKVKNVTDVQGHLADYI